MQIAGREVKVVNRGRVIQIGCQAFSKTTLRTILSLQGEAEGLTRRQGILVKGRSLKIPCYCGQKGCISFNIQSHVLVHGKGVSLAYRSWPDAYAPLREHATWRQVIEAAKLVGVEV